MNPRKKHSREVMKDRLFVLTRNYLVDWDWSLVDQADYTSVNHYWRSTGDHASVRGSKAFSLMSHRVRSLIHGKLGELTDVVTEHLETIAHIDSADDESRRMNSLAARRRRRAAVEMIVLTYEAAPDPRYTSLVRGLIADDLLITRRDKKAKSYPHTAARASLWFRRVMSHIDEEGLIRATERMNEGGVVGDLIRNYVSNGGSHGRLHK